MAEKRRCMNYRKGDDLIYGPMGPGRRVIAGFRRTKIHDGDPARKKRGSALKEKGSGDRWGSCNLHVLTVASLTADQADRLLTGNVQGVSYSGVEKLERAVVDISYPLKHYVEVQIESGMQGGEPHMTVGYILWQAAQAYKRIYEEEADDGRHGVWGHCLSDLFFEFIRPYASGYCELLIGS